MVARSGSADDPALPPVVVIFRAATADRFPEVAAAVVRGGVRRIEFTLTTPGALGALRSARSELPEGVLIGCGTVRTQRQVDEAVAAGADFLVSQVFDPVVAEHAAASGVPFIPGALTPTEIVRAADAGNRLVKVSPIGPLGGLAYLRELVGPLPEVELFPTGGVEPAEVGEYLRSGAALIGVSGRLLGEALHSERDLDELSERARAMLATIPAGPWSFRA